MGGRLPWRRVEDDVLLRAWARVGDVPPVAAAQDALLEHYEALCPHARIRCHRSAESLFARKCALERMHEFICAFHDRQLASEEVPATAAATSDGLEPDSTFKYSSGDWFALAAWEQQHWVATLSTACGVFVDMKKYQFDEIDAILKAANGNEERPCRYAAQAMAPSTPTSTASAPTAGEHPSSARLTDEFVRTMIERFITRDTSSANLRLAADDAHIENASSTSRPLANEYSRTMVERFIQENATVNPLALSTDSVAVREPRLSNEVKESADARTESATVEIDSETNSSTWWDEIVPRSPTTIAPDEHQEPTLGVDGKDDSRDLSAWHTESAKILQHKSGNVWRDAQQYNEDLLSERSAPTKKRRRSASDRNLVDATCALETESQALSTLVLRELKERESDAHDRAMFSKMVDACQVERDRVLDEIRRSEDAIRRERDEWAREQEDMKHEIGRMRERVAWVLGTQGHGR